MQIILACIPQTMAYAVSCICNVLNKTRNCNNDVGELQCHRVFLACAGVSTIVFHQQIVYIISDIMAYGKYSIN
jgi:hypothetical protein